MCGYLQIKQKEIGADEVCTQYNISGKFLGTSIIFNIIFKTMQYLNLPSLPRTYGRFTLFSGAGSSLQSPEISKHQCTEN